MNNHLKYSQDWFFFSEIKKYLLNFIDINKKYTILEIGCFEGLSSVFFAEKILHHKDSTLTCVDPFLSINDNDHLIFLMDDEEKNFDYNISHCKNKEKIIIKKQSSDMFFQENNKTYNLIYIDGCHKSDFILRDMENSFKILDDNGILWIDDYGGKNDISIKKIINVFKENYKGQYEIIHQCYQTAFRKIKI
jgi:predicted O-methyltransferase YrrM